MKRISCIIVLFLLMAGLRTNAQTTFAAVQTKTGFTRLENDSIVLTPASGLRGALQWQSTTDLVTWTDVASNLPGAALAFKPQTTKTYRLKITEGACNPIYGDTIKIFAMGTTLGEYVKVIPVFDLFSAGVQSSELLPALTTSSVNSITQKSANCGGTITSEGCTVVTSRGVCWNITGSPTIANSKTTDGTGSGSFTSSITGLISGTTYYVSAYATNSAGTSYGTVQTFTTSPAPGVPVVTTSDVSNLTQTTAACGGNVTSAGTSTVTARGVCWNTFSGPTTANSLTTDGTGTGVFTSSITGLTANTTYYVRAYATSSAGTSYGGEKTFTTPDLSAPVVNTSDVSNLTQTTATCGGNVSSTGTSTVTARGVCWNTSSGPTTTNIKTTDGTGTGAFTSSMTGLTANTTYYVRAYATNSTGTSYGVEESFITASYLAPVVNTSDVSNLTQTTATGGGNVTSAGTSTVTARGICWSTSTGPTTTNIKTTDGTGTGTFTSSINGLTANTTYYVRAYAINSTGTSYGAEKTFTTPDLSAPVVNTSDVSSIAQTTATCGGNVSSAGTSTVTARGICWNTSLAPTTANSKTSDGTGTGIFTSSITGLTATTTYYVRAYATNTTGTSYGAEKVFTTPAHIPPAVNTADVDTITPTSASCGGNVTSAGTLLVIARGVCWNTSGAPTTADNITLDSLGTGTFISKIIGLTPDMTYYVRAYAQSQAGISYGEEMVFKTTINTGSAKVIDYDGNLYDTVTIGKQIWLKQNLKVTHYNNGDLIPLFPTKTVEGTGYRGYYTTLGYDSASYAPIYGALYNYYAVVDSRNLCPAGWFVPSYDDWNTLFNYLGGIGKAGDKLKESGTTHWPSPNSGTNSSGFIALPGGAQPGTLKAGKQGIFWMSTESNWNNAYSFLISPTSASGVYTIYASGMGYGNSVRCMKRYLPEVTTAEVTDVTTTSVRYSGDVTSHGYPTTAKGVCWNTTGNPTISDNKTIDGSGTGSFTNNITGLTQLTTYYVRAYATNVSGTAYGGVKAFTTLAVAPVVNTLNVSYIGATEIICGGNVTSAGGSGITDRGLCWNTTGNPVITDNKQSAGTAIGSFSLDILTLSPGTTYYMRAYAKNSTNIGYGELKTFTTLAAGSIPAVTTQTVRNITVSSATIDGNVTSQGSSAVTERGVIYVKSNSSSDIIPSSGNFTQIAGSGAGAFSVTITGLTDNTRYIVRTYAKNASGIVYGETLDFRTVSILPNLATEVATNIKYTRATVGGYLYSTGSTAMTECGVCWNKTGTPTIADNKQVVTGGAAGAYFYSNLTGLQQGTTYYVRAYATNNAGTAYGNVISFTTTELGTVADADGNIYNLVIIGEQVWMAKNLATTRYRDGQLIGTTSPATLDISSESEPKYQWAPNNREDMIGDYGRLYTWYAVTNTSSVCPVGSHVPTKSEWATLITYFTSNPDMSGFTFKPGGWRTRLGGFKYFQTTNYWWSSEGSGLNAFCLKSDLNSINMEASACYMSYGLSVRCLMDE
jgi:uncharacterized protein (TIGR02145 family)